MVNGIKGCKLCREVEEKETGDLLTTNGIKMIVKRKKYSFGRMKW